MEQHLGVGGGFKHVARRQQVLFNLLIVVNLPVKGEHFCAVLVEDGLAPALQVDDGKPPEAQGNGAIHIVVGVVRSPVADGVRHRVEHPLVPEGVAAVNISHKAAHGPNLPFSC